MPCVSAFSALGRLRVINPSPSFTSNRISASDMPHPINKRREMITRMISLVPSRIWCTRKSRK